MSRAQGNARLIAIVGSPDGAALTAVKQHQDPQVDRRRDIESVYDLV